MASLDDPAVDATPVAAYSSPIFDDTVALVHPMQPLGVSVYQATFSANQIGNPVLKVTHKC